MTFDGHSKNVHGTAAGGSGLSRLIYQILNSKALKMLKARLQITWAKCR